MGREQNYRTEKRLVTRSLRLNAKMAEIPSISAHWRKTCITSGRCWSTTAGELRLKIPAFSNAICSSVFPKTWVCSRSINVMPVVMGCWTTFVASRRPPIPTSRTTTSTFASMNTRKAISVKNRKNPGHRVIYGGSSDEGRCLISCNLDQTTEKCRRYVSLEICFPLMQNRSHKD